MEDPSLDRPVATGSGTTDKAFRSLVEHAIDLIAVVGADMLVRYVNRAVQDLLGYTPAEVVGRPALSFLHADDALAGQAFYEESLSRPGEPIFGRFRLTHRDGSVRVAEGTLTNLLGDPNIAGVVANARDRTECTRVEEEQRFQAQLLASVRESVVATDLQGRITYWGRGAEALYGYRADEVIGRSVTFIVPAEAVAEEEERIRIALETGSWSGQYEQVRADGSTFWADTRISLVLDDRNRPCGFLGIDRDITEERERAEELRATSRRLDLLLQLDRAILRERSPRAIARAAINALRHTVRHCDRVSVIYFDESRREGELLAVAGHCGELRAGSRIPLRPRSSPMVQELLRGRRSIIADLRTFDRPHPAQQQLLREGFRSAVRIPLRAHGKVVGSLNLGSRKVGALDERTIEIAQGAAQAIAIGVHQSHLLEELGNARRQLQDLSRRLVATHEAERQNLARELHDEVGQLLTGLKYNLRSTIAAEEREKRLEEARDLVDRLIGEVRNLSLDLRPALLDDLGLAPTLEWYVERYREKSGVDVDLDARGLDRPLSPETETTVYRIVQEALTNIARHAEVERARVRVDAKKTVLNVLVQDRGKGFELAPAGAARTAGLRGMRERVQLLGGRLEIESRPGKGTRVRARLPIGR